jgi:hypothetical protein
MNQSPIHPAAPVWRATHAVRARLLTLARAGERIAVGVIAMLGDAGRAPRPSGWTGPGRPGTPAVCPIRVERYR